MKVALKSTAKVQFTISGDRLVTLWKSLECIPQLVGDWFLKAAGNHWHEIGCTEVCVPVLVVAVSHSVLSFWFVFY